MAEKTGYYSLRKVLDTAISFEQDSADFYRDLLGKTDRRDAKDLLQVLAEQELEHKRKLEAVAVAGELDAIFIQFPPELSLSMPVLKKSDPTASELLELAIKREILSAEIYEKTSIHAPGPLQALLLGLASFERVHERNLKELQLE